MKRNNRGFTLVELLAVIIVLAIIMVIAIPAVLETTARARKRSLFLYAQSIQSKAVAKYTQDLDSNSSILNNTVNVALYDIETDLELPDTGSYKGWALVERKPIEDENAKREVIVNVSNVKNLQYVKYCVSKNATCTPDTTFHFSKDEKNDTQSVKVRMALEKGYTMCVSYQYPDDKGTLKTVSGANLCKNYNSGEAITDNYDYFVRISLMDSNYYVENVVFSEDMTEEEFNKEIDTAEKRTPMYIYAPAENGGVNTSLSKGDAAAAKTTIVTTTTTTQRGTQIEGTTTTSQRSTQIEGTTTTVRDTSIITTTSTTNRNDNTTIITTTTTLDPTDPANTTIDSTTSTTTIDVNDISLLLSTLEVAGYDIGFDPLKFYYNLTVPNDVTSLTVTATSQTPDLSIVTVSGADSLAVGRNVVLVKVTNLNNGKEGTYHITVNRYIPPISDKTTGPTKEPEVWDPDSGAPDPSLDESNANLIRLSVSGYSFDFEGDVYEYTIQTRGEEKLDIVALPASDKANLYINGNSGLQDGSEITILVESQNRYYKKTYKIKVNFVEEEPETNPVIRSIAIGLGLLLVVILIVAYLTKRGKSKMIGDVLEKEEQDLTSFDSAANMPSSPFGGGGSSAPTLPTTPQPKDK